MALLKKSLPKLFIWTLSTVIILSSFQVSAMNLLAQKKCLATNEEIYIFLVILASRDPQFSLPKEILCAIYWNILRITQQPMIANMKTSDLYFRMQWDSPEKASLAISHFCKIKSEEPSTISIPFLKELFGTSIKDLYTPASQASVLQDACSSLDYQQVGLLIELFDEKLLEALAITHGGDTSLHLVLDAMKFNTTDEIETLTIILKGLEDSLAIHPQKCHEMAALLGMKNSQGLTIRKLAKKNKNLIAYDMLTAFEKSLETMTNIPAMPKRSRPCILQ